MSRLTYEPNDNSGDASSSDLVIDFFHELLLFRGRRLIGLGALVDFFTRLGKLHDPLAELEPLVQIVYEGDHLTSVIAFAQLL